VTDDRCYGGLIGQGFSCVSTDGTTLEAVTPIIPTSGIKVVSVWASAGAFVGACLIKVLKRTAHDVLHEIRTRWPDWYNVGPRDFILDTDE
jgi:hypothetical protein